MNYLLAWWNLENLFDIENAPDRPEWLASKLRSELEGWTADILAIKLRQLAQVINAMNDGQGPDILGVCEVENRAVLEKLLATLDLPQRQYALVHADTADARGIDVAFIYDRQLFSVDAANVFNQVILRRNATRDILQATFTINASGNEFILLGNHWPSRSGGVEESAPYRMMAGETLAYFHQRIVDIRGDIPVIAMGDFNDEPYDRSLETYALAVRSPNRVKSKRARKPYLYNMMWSLMGPNKGTHNYDDTWSMLDQVMINRPLFYRPGLHCYLDDAAIFTLSGMIDDNEPVRFNRPSSSGGIIETGFSDHLPITLTLREDLDSD